MAKTQHSPGYTSCGGQPLHIRPPTPWGSLADITHGPVYCTGAGIVDRDWRLPGHNWVPYELANETDWWTLETCVDASTLNVASLPAGWAKTETDGGTVTVGGGEILITAPADGFAVLYYTFPSLGAGYQVRIVVNCYEKSACSADSETYVGLIDSRRNDYAFWYLDQYGALGGWWDGSLDPHHPPVTTAAEFWIRWHYSTNVNNRSDVYRASYQQSAMCSADGTQWTGAAAFDQVAFVTGSGTGIGDTVMAIDHIAIYVGAE